MIDEWMVLLGVAGLAALLLGTLVLAWRRRRALPPPPPAVEAPASPPAPPPPAPPAQPVAPARDLAPAPPAAAPPAAAPPPAAPPAAAVSADRVDAALAAALRKTTQGPLGRIRQLFAGAPQFDAAALEELEELLLRADVGIKVTSRCIDVCRAVPADQQNLATLLEVLRRQLLETLNKVEHGVPATLQAATDRPRVVLVVGVNGVGKTTTLGKVAAHFKAAGRRVTLAAGDTFRAAAPEQLQLWGERTGTPVVRGAAAADPASVIFNAVQSAVHDKVDLVLADTAGRLHTQADLMDEVKKLRRAAGKACPGAPDAIWLVVDATTGQNALLQARQFHQALQLTGLILTKLDGTAKGGVVLALVEELGLPLHFVGVGEAVGDLRPFSSTAFVDGLLAAPPAAT